MANVVDPEHFEPNAYLVNVALDANDTRPCICGNGTPTQALAEDSIKSCLRSAAGRELYVELIQHTARASRRGS